MARFADTLAPDMPTYEYRCEACGSEFEVQQSFSDDSVPSCPNRPKVCTARGTSKIRKIYSAPGITFKGSGFYKNDARTSGKKSSSTASSDTVGSESSSSSSSTSSSADTTTDTKKPAKSGSSTSKKDSVKSS